MKMNELLSAVAPSVNLGDYCRHITPRLDPSKLTMDALTSTQRGGLRVPFEGDASLLIRYQGYEGAISSIAEQANGEVWKVLQVQGAKSRKSYRIDSGLSWRPAFAAQIRTYAEHPESEVRQLWMPPTYGITNLTDAVSLENAKNGYGVVAAALGLRWSDADNAYVADVTKNTKTELLKVVDDIA